MRLADLGEFDLIARIKRRAAGFNSPEVAVGIGDDAAVLRPKCGEDLVVSTDALVENIHFRFRNQTASHVGRRALLVNLSDLAAMGARPVGFTLALSAPPSTTVATIDGLLTGLLKEARAYGCPLVGGNLSRGSEMTLAVTVFGAVSKGRALLRSSARPGDRIFVTGTLGGAALALRKSEERGGKMSHLPTARVAAARGLARRKQRTACIDLSDGLLSDLQHVVAASSCGAVVDPSRIPLARGLVAACKREGLDPLHLATEAGEDYELLFTLPAKTASRTSESVLSKQLGVQVSEIGTMTREPGVRGLGEDSSVAGYRHF